MASAPVTHQPGLFHDINMGKSTSECDANWRSSKPFAVPNLILTQPGLGVTTTTITTVTQTGGDWSSGLFDVCEDETTCILGMMVPCFLDLSLSHQFGETLCTPLLPGSTFAIRVGMRERYKIQGNVLNDWTAVCCCYPLAICQMIREMKRRMKVQTYHVSTALQSS